VLFAKTIRGRFRAAALAKREAPAPSPGRACEGEASGGAPATTALGVSAAACSGPVGPSLNHHTRTTMLIRTHVAALAIASAPLRVCGIKERARLTHPDNSSSSPNDSASDVSSHGTLSSGAGSSTTWGVGSGSGAGTGGSGIQAGAACSEATTWGTS
jgi:hypothetical protein